MECQAMRLCNAYLNGLQPKQTLAIHLHAVRIVNVELSMDKRFVLVSLVMSVVHHLVVQNAPSIRIVSKIWHVRTLNVRTLALAPVDFLPNVL